MKGICALAALLLTAVPAFADSYSEQLFEANDGRGVKADFFFGDVEAGTQAGWGRCPCFRWTLRVELAGGRFETREFLVSTDAIFKLDLTMLTSQGIEARRLFRFGAIEALWKGARIGVGFKGITWGDDKDWGYTDIFRTGAHLLVNLIRTEALGLDIRSGYEFEALNFNVGREVERHLVPHSMTFSWQTGRWGGELSTRFDFNPIDPGQDLADRRFGAAAALHGDVFSIQNIIFGSGVEMNYAHDPIQRLFGMEPHAAVLGLYVDLRYEPRGK